MATLHVGDAIHGFANGVFGRDSYTCRVVEAEGRDWLVTRNADDVVEMVTRADASRIAEPEERDYCADDCPIGQGSTFTRET